MFKDKRTPGQELPGRPSETQTQGKNGKGISADRPPKEPRRAGADKSSQEQERPVSIRRSYHSQPKDAPETKRQTGVGLKIK